MIQLECKLILRVAQTSLISHALSLRGCSHMTPHWYHMFLGLGQDQNEGLRDFDFVAPGGNHVSQTHFFFSHHWHVCMYLCGSSKAKHHIVTTFVCCPSVCQSIHLSPWPSLTKKNYTKIYVTYTRNILHIYVNYIYPLCRYMLAICICYIYVELGPTYTLPSINNYTHT